jgi:hypothetical protein
VAWLMDRNASRGVVFFDEVWNTIRYDGKVHQRRVRRQWGFLGGSCFLQFRAVGSKFDS